MKIFFFIFLIVLCFLQGCIIHPKKSRIEKHARNIIIENLAGDTGKFWIEVKNKHFAFYISRDLKIVQLFKKDDCYDLFDFDDVTGLEVIETRLEGSNLKDKCKNYIWLNYEILKLSQDSLKVFNFNENGTVYNFKNDSIKLCLNAFSTIRDISPVPPRSMLNKE